MTMNVETTASNLNSALRLMSGLIERRNTIPVLGAVKIGGGKVVGTNLDMEVQVQLPQSGEGAGECAIDYAPLATLSKHIPADEWVKVSEADSIASVTFNGSDYRIPSYPAVDFPEFGQVDGPRTLTDNAGLVSAMRRVSFAVSTEETRYYLNGVAIVKAPDGATLAVATNGHLLALAPFAVEIDGSLGAIIHKQTVAYLCARKGEPKAVTFQQETKPRAKFEYDGLVLSAKLIDGTFPDIFRVIPKDAKPVFAVDTSAILPPLKRMAAFMRGSHNAMKVSVSADGIELSARLHGIDGGKEKVAGELLHSAPVEVVYNINYLIEILSKFSGGRVTFSATDPAMVAGHPCAIECENDDLRCVLMPMRV